ncbi:hypothetical protein VP01_1394g2 [Puccinia sorghi]|uniref:Uncharacterized protein n=1 Tax=Puccinia sorghi TaxID=27349 RepID=A0A0L6VMZ3_9BASI|nr:hypothetical protein VP01_1394g2 [Puccinia sorghi]
MYDNIYFNFPNEYYPLDGTNQPFFFFFHSNLMMHLRLASIQSLDFLSIGSKFDWLEHSKIEELMFSNPNVLIQKTINFYVAFLLQDKKGKYNNYEKLFSTNSETFWIAMVILPLCLKLVVICAQNSLINCLQLGFMSYIGYDLLESQLLNGDAEEGETILMYADWTKEFKIEGGTTGLNRVLKKVKHVFELTNKHKHMIILKANILRRHCIKTLLMGIRIKNIIDLTDKRISNHTSLEDTLQIFFLEIYLLAFTTAFPFLRDRFLLPKKKRFLFSLISQFPKISTPRIAYHTPHSFLLHSQILLTRATKSITNNGQHRSSHCNHCRRCRYSHCLTTLE